MKQGKKINIDFKKSIGKAKKKSVDNAVKAQVHNLVEAFEKMEFHDQNMELINHEKREELKKIPQEEWNTHPEIMKFVQEVYMVQSLKLIETYIKLSTWKKKCYFKQLVTKQIIEGKPNEGYSMTDQEFDIWVLVHKELFKL